MSTEASQRQALRLSENARRVLERRYLLKDEKGRVTETPESMFRRVATNISRAELVYGGDEAARRRWEEAFFGVMSRLEFLPNSPTLMNAGTDIQQLSACFVLPVEDSMDGIFESLKHTALIHKSGGGTGFSFSRIRPQKDVVRSTRGISSGPLSFMNVFDAATETVKQGGRRRGANMAILRVDHPDILEFIASKDRTDRLNNFNISVAITDRFMEALAADDAYDLINPRTGTPVGRLRAREVFDRIVDSAWRTGEPGVVFIDRINRDNPTPALGDIESTNPCGEQPLLPYESCNLGSINLARFARGRLGECTIDWERLDETVRTAVRFLDDVIDMNRYPLPQIAELTRGNRKIGLGVMGFADLLIRMGIPYDHPEALDVAEQVMQRVQDTGREASRELARERGPFPNFSRSVYAQRNEPPVRNATVTTIAPTGSISIIADTSSGVEPLFALAFVRRVLDGDELVEVNSTFRQVAQQEGFYSEALVERVARGESVRDIEAIPPRWRDVLRTAHDITPEDHVRIQAAFQKYTDNAVSKTVNFPHDATHEDVAAVFRSAFDLGCKGVTIYRDGSRDAQVLSTGTASSGAVTSSDASTAAAVAGEDGAGEGAGNGNGNGNGKGDRPASAGAVATPPGDTTGALTPRPRPEAVEGVTRRMVTGCGSLYVTINHDAAGPFEVFAQIGKAGGCAASQTEAIGRLISLALRSGVDAGAIARQLRGVRCPSPAWNRGEKVYSCADAIGQAMLRQLQSQGGADVGATPGAAADRLAGTCPECKNELQFESGCAVCHACGYSRC